MRPDDVRREVLGLLAQGATFLVGLVISLSVGMVLAARTTGPGLLILATLVAGFGLLGGALVSQLVHDRLVYGAGDTDTDTIPNPT